MTVHRLPDPYEAHYGSPTELLEFIADHPDRHIEVLAISPDEEGPFAGTGVTIQYRLLRRAAKP